MKFIFFIIVIISTIFLSCKKDKEDKYCWTIVDNLGNEYAKVCDKTELEMNTLYPTGCNYYKYEEQKYCWLVNGNFIKNASESQMAYYTKCQALAQGQKVDCSYCEKLYSREKRTYKPTSSTNYTVISTKVYCGNELTSIPPNKQIVRKDDADSLIIIQFSIDGVNW